VSNVPWVASLPRLSLLAAVLVASGSAGARADDETTSLEYPVKASLLLNFAKFAEWPSGSQQAAAARVAICVLGNDPFGDVLESTMAGRTVGGHPVEVRRYRTLDGIDSCHVLYISGSESRRLPDVLATVGGAPVLTVGEFNDFDARGGIIRLVVQNNRAGFVVNLSATERSHLRLSSRLLAVARSVRRAGHP
jgi:hypothetical protein